MATSPAMVSPAPPRLVSRSTGSCCCGVWRMLQMRACSNQVVQPDNAEMTDAGGLATNVLLVYTTHDIVF